LAARIIDYFGRSFIVKKFSAFGVIVFVLVFFGCSFGASESAEPLFKTRVLYAPGHFGNTYESAGQNEMYSLLKEAKRWGYNSYKDWFDRADCADPYVATNYCLSRGFLENKKRNYLIAQKLGFKCGLSVSANHVFLDQCLPGLLADKSSGYVFGQLLCPSIPQARAIILRNYDNLFKDLAESGIKLNFISPFAYDFGGCACELCKPWILTFAQLNWEIYEIAERYHPGIEVHFFGWCWSEEEHALFKQWADEKHPGWVKNISMWMNYGMTDVADYPLPVGCKRNAFVNLAYAELSSPKDQYTLLGPVIAADRIEKTMRELSAHGCDGIVGYSEGVFEDVSVMIAGGLASGQYKTADEAMAAYAERYFEVDAALAKKWAAWIRAWGKPYQRDAKKAMAEMEELLSQTSARNWRLEQWICKAKIMEVNEQITDMEGWSAERLLLVDKLWAVKEHLMRKVWGYGNVREIMPQWGRAFKWYKSWLAETGGMATITDEPDWR
jgi:hypothetical protein